MVMYVMLREEMPELRRFLERRGYRTAVIPDGPIGLSGALLLGHPSIAEILTESFNAGHSMRLIIIVDECEVFLVSTLLPDAVVLSHASKTLRNDIIRGLSGYCMNKRKAPLLTDPEKRLLHMLSFGVTNKELAKRLKRSERTVRRLKESLYEKTGLVSSQQLLLYSLFRLSTRSS